MYLKKLDTAICIQPEKKNGSLIRFRLLLPVFKVPFTKYIFKNVLDLAYLVVNKHFL